MSEINFAHPHTLIKSVERVLNKVGPELFFSSPEEEVKKAREGFAAYFFTLALKKWTGHDWWLAQYDQSIRKYPDFDFVSFGEEPYLIRGEKVELTGVYPHFKDFKEMWKVIEKKKNKYGKEMLDFSLLVFVNHAKGEEWINQFKSRFQTQQPFKCIWTLHLLYINNGQEVKKVVAQKFSSDQQFVRIVVDLDDTEVHKLQKFPNYVEKKEQDGNIYLYPKKEFGEMIKRKVKKF
jgi:hypothetical protein